MFFLIKRLYEFKWWIPFSNFPPDLLQSPHGKVLSEKHLFSWAFAQSFFGNSFGHWLQFVGSYSWLIICFWSVFLIENCWQQISHKNSLFWYMVANKNTKTDKMYPKIRYPVCMCAIVCIFQIIPDMDALCPFPSYVPALNVFTLFTIP